ncbi:IclR family transcriptional regulator [Pseudonocardia sp. CA-107938]|uniref:IclR family transcriptional regulator n=1 Tax=Pseudonocardia sp. CA-107938 TaxID=3240021 RepID=UPI003D903A46
MPGPIQSVERAAALLRLLGGTGRSLGLGELAAALALPKPTAHGILRTLRDAGFVEQDASGRYRLGAALADLGRGGPDPHDLRAAAMNWADALAGATGFAVQLGVLRGHAVRVVHHVFRPDASPQRLLTGTELPLHASALGKCLYAFAPVGMPRVRELDMHPWTGRTVVSPVAFEGHLAVARRRGWASDLGEYEPAVGGAAAPVRSAGGLVVGALAVLGPVEELFAGEQPRRPVIRELQSAARAVSRTLATSA